MKRLGHLMTDRYRHAIRSVHAKSHGLLKAETTVLGDLSEPFRQGILDAVIEFFKTETAQWNIEVQLRTNAETMPVENASVVWPQAKSPFVPVARIIAKPQDVYSPARRVFVDDKLAFNPWHALEAHRPLGNIMRARKASYDVSAELRQASNAVVGVEPKSIDEIPD